MEIRVGLYNLQIGHELSISGLHKHYPDSPESEVSDGEERKEETAAEETEDRIDKQSQSDASLLDEKAVERKTIQFLGIVSIK